MKILFSEDEWYYRDLGLTDIKGVNYTFGGMRFYKSSLKRLSEFQLFVCAYYTMPHNVLLTRKFESLGVRTALCCDGIFDFSNAFLNVMHRKYDLIQFHPIIQDHFICVGVREANYFRSGVDSMEYMPKRMISSDKPSPYPDENRVLVTTANTSYFNSEEYIKLLRLLSEILELFIKNNVDFSLRIFDNRLFGDLNLKFSIPLFNDVDEEFEKTIERYSGVVTTPSSVAVVSMFHKRPTALLIYRDFPLFLQTGWLVPSASVFESSLHGFLSLDKSRMTIQDNLFLNYATENGLTDRITQILNKKSIVKFDNENFIDKSYENMLNSKFNINIEWRVRRTYRFLKKISLFSNLINSLKRSIF
jgi:hypothetical protein